MSFDKPRQVSEALWCGNPKDHCRRSLTTPGTPDFNHLVSHPEVPRQVEVVNALRHLSVREVCDIGTELLGQQLTLFHPLGQWRRWTAEQQPAIQRTLLDEVLQGRAC